jgi:hypothetical protein
VDHVEHEELRQEFRSEQGQHQSKANASPFKGAKRDDNRASGSPLQAEKLRRDGRAEQQCRNNELIS